MGTLRNIKEGMHNNQILFEHEMLLLPSTRTVLLHADFKVISQLKGPLPCL